MLRVDRDRRRGRPGGGRARRRRCGAGPALDRARHVRRRLRRAPRIPARAGGAAAHVLPRRSRHLARDGRDALGRRLAASGCTTPRRDARTRSCSAEAETLGAGRRGTALRAVPRRASGRRTPIRTRAAPSPASRSATTAARSSGPCSRALPTGCATRSSCCGAWASRLTSAGCPAAEPAASSGSRIVASILGMPLERTMVEEGAAYGAALLGGVNGGGFADVHEASRAARPRARPDRAGAGLAGRPTSEGYARYRQLYPALRRLLVDGGSQNAGRQPLDVAWTNVGGSCRPLVSYRKACASEIGLDRCRFPATVDRQCPDHEDVGRDDHDRPHGVVRDEEEVGDRAQ